MEVCVADSAWAFSWQVGFLVWTCHEAWTGLPATETLMLLK